MSSGGEPLSDELEAEIAQTITDLYLSIPAHPSDREYRFDRAAGPILRAFAREIQTGTTKAPEDYSGFIHGGMRSIKASPEIMARSTAEIFANPPGMRGLRAALLASQEREKALAEALEWYGRGIVSMQSEAHARGDHGLGKGRDPECPMCDDGRKAREALAYRGSGRGEGKP